MSPCGTALESQFSKVRALPCGLVVLSPHSSFRFALALWGGFEKSCVGLLIRAQESAESQPCCQHKPYLNDSTRRHSIAHLIPLETEPPFCDEIVFQQWPSVLVGEDFHSPAIGAHESKDTSRTHFIRASALAVEDSFWGWNDIMESC